MLHRVKLLECVCIQIGSVGEERRGEERRGEERRGEETFTAGEKSVL
jgi:hypothetical protein